MGEGKVERWRQEGDHHQKGTGIEHGGTQLSSQQQGTEDHHELKVRLVYLVSDNPVWAAVLAIFRCYIKHHDQKQLMGEFILAYGYTERVHNGVSGMAANGWSRKLWEHMFNRKRWEEPRE